jgi:hypothetical protein
MRRKAHNRLWTIVFTLLLCTASAVSMAGYARAEMTPVSDPPPTGGPPGPQAGDPDWPDGGAARSPRPGPARGVSQPSGQNGAAARPSWLSVWMMKVRMAFLAGFRAFFPF